MANKGLIITTPRAQTITAKAGGGSISASLAFNARFGSERTQQFTNAQRFIDGEVLRLCTPYVPMDTSVLIKSGILGTVIGTGEVRYISLYAARLYYNPQYHFNDAPQRGAYWFERMKADHKSKILDGAKKHTGGK